MLREEKSCSKEDKFLQQPYVRRLIIFCVAFMATHDVLISLIITLIFMLKYLATRGLIYKVISIRKCWNPATFNLRSYFLVLVYFTICIHNILMVMDQ